MGKPPKALVFDLDGVLVHSEPAHRRTWIECLREEGFVLRPEEEPHLQGRTGEQVIEWLKTRRDEIPQGCDFERMIARKRELYRGIMAQELQPVAGVDAFLRRHKSVLPLGLVTSSKLKVVGQIMLLFNWRNIFDALVGAEHVTRPKPHPEPFEHVAARFKLRPAECLVFEDSEVGIESARQAGSPVCGVATTLTPEQLRKAGALWTITDFRDDTVLEMALAGYRPGKLFGWISRMKHRGD